MKSLTLACHRKVDTRRIWRFLFTSTSPIHCASLGRTQQYSEPYRVVWCQQKYSFHGSSFIIGRQKHNDQDKAWQKDDKRNRTKTKPFKVKNIVERETNKRRQQAKHHRGSLNVQTDLQGQARKKNKNTIETKTKGPSASAVKTKPSRKVGSSFNDNDFDVFVSCLPGLESLLSAELASLGIKSCTTAGGGGVETTLPSLTYLFKCHLWLGTASHVLWRCGKPFTARGLAELSRKVKDFYGDFWRQVVVPGATLNVRVTSSKSKLYHTSAIAERVSNGIQEALTTNSNDKKKTMQTKTSNSSNEVQLVVRVHKDVVQISIDTSSTPLHQRGYRLQTAKAPLREDLAYSLLYVAGWTPAEASSPFTANPPYTALLDPFCGSGTIAIEGAAMRAGLPPGRLRSAPLMGTYLYKPKAWEKLKNDVLCRSNNDSPVMVWASDRDEGAIDAARSNARRAGILRHIHFSACAVGSQPLFDQGHDNLLVATNPPYGKRLSHANNLLPLYQTLGHRIQQTNAQAAIMALDPNMARKTGLPVKAAFTSQHGGMPVSAMITRKTKH